MIPVWAIALICVLVIVVLVAVVLCVTYFAWPLGRGDSDALLTTSGRALAERETRVPDRRTLWLTHYDVEGVPKHIMENFRKHASEFTIRIFDDDACESYLKRNFEPRVVQRFLSMPRGAHKADIFRFAALYLEGGVYLDIKTLPLRAIQDVFPQDKAVFTLAHLHHVAGCHIGIVGAPRGHPAVNTVFQFVLEAPLVGIKVLYLWFCFAAYRAARQHADSVEFLEERCADEYCSDTGGRDRYGKCCTIHHPQLGYVMNSRDPKYPWS